MSALKRRKVYDTPMPNDSAAKQEDLRTVKLEVERMRDRLQKSIIDDVQTARKAALLISQWIEGKQMPRKKKTGK